jgi:hypothetical protein
MRVRGLLHGAFFVLLCSGPLTPALAERPIEKTLWLSLPISIRSASEQGRWSSVGLSISARTGRPI